MSKPHVLICDDELGVRESLKHLLEDEYELAYAANGLEAVEYVKANEPDLVILDIKMPKLDGLQALRRMKGVKPDVRVLMITGYEATQVAAQAINAGAADYITKPFDGEKVLAQVRKLVNSEGA